MKHKRWIWLSLSVCVCKIRVSGNISCKSTVSELSINSESICWTPSSRERARLIKSRMTAACQSPKVSPEVARIRLASTVAHQACADRATARRPIVQDAPHIVRNRLAPASAAAAAVSGVVLFRPSAEIACIPVCLKCAALIYRQTVASATTVGNWVVAPPAALLDTYRQCWYCVYTDIIRWLGLLPAYIWLCFDRLATAAASRRRCSNRPPVLRVGDRSHRKFI